MRNRVINPILTKARIKYLNQQASLHETNNPYQISNYQLKFLLIIKTLSLNCKIFNNLIQIINS